MSCVLAFAEQRDGQFKKAAIEAVSQARRIATALGGECVGLVVGSGVTGLAAGLGAYGADRVLVVDHADLKNYANGAYAKAVAAAAQSLSPAAILLGATAMGKDLAPLVGAALGTSVAMDCTGMSAEGGKIVCKRPAFAGKVIQTIEFAKPPVLATLRPNVFAPQAPENGRAAKVEALAVSFEPKDLACRVESVELSAGKKIELTEAGTVCAGGRGMKGAEHFKLIEDLAAVVGGAVGASRAVVDAGWRPHEDQVGQTGKTVSPNLYFAFGISGAIQHIAGMSSSKVIVAVNKDADAPIFKIANYGIVGDAFEVLPALTAECKKLLGA